MDVQQRLSKAKMEWTRLCDITFPEFRRHFNQHSKWAYELFKFAPSPDKIARLHKKTILELIAVHGDRNAATDQLKELAKNSIGQNSRSIQFLIKNTLSDIFHFSTQMKELEDEITKLIHEHFSNLLTIPGVGPITAGLIVGEIGDINKFRSSAALVAYAGLDPIIYESGLFKARTVNISKRGSKYLRTAIFTSTKVACINPNIRDNKFRIKYLKKLHQGKHHYSAICHCTKNMINTIYAMLKTGETYKHMN
jgi:transposase